ncbi:unnamed protein product [Sympodiomycopsis kandeliae]
MSDLHRRPDDEETPTPVLLSRKESSDGQATSVKEGSLRKRSGGDDSDADSETVLVGRDNLSSAIPPDAAYEGRHRWDPEAKWTVQEERRVVRKTDIWLMSWLCVMFFGLQLDREFPVQFLTKRYGFRRVLPTLMLGWGTVSWAQAFITERTGFYITRALIGAFEGGFIPATILFATYFYTSKEIAVRLAGFWSTLNVARIISALLAAGILEMRGVSGKPGWFWLFLLEGLLTVVLAIISFLYLPAAPTKTTNVLFRKPWYTEREEVIMINRILRDDPAKGRTLLKEPAKWKDVKATWSDKSLWGLFFIGLVAYIPATPVTGYLTLTLKRLGFSTFDSNMLMIPSAVLQMVTMLTLAWSSDRFGQRALHCIFGEFWIMPLLIALLTIHNGGQEWSRFTLVTLISGYPYFHPIVTSWISENTFDVKKRAIAAATYNVIVQIGSLIGSQIYRSYDSPYYKQGNKVLVSICALSLVSFVVQRQYLIYLNARKEKAWKSMSTQEQKDYQEDLDEREKEGNQRLDFRFAY